MTMLFPDLVKNFKKSCKRYQDDWKLYIKLTMSRISYLKGTSDLEDLVYALQITQYDIGQYIFLPGQEINSIKFILEG